MKKLIFSLTALLSSCMLLVGCSGDKPEAQIIQADYGLYHASLTNDGRYALVATVDHAALLWDLWERQLLHTWRHKTNETGKSEITLTAIAGQGQYAATVQGAVFALWNVQSGKTVRYWQMPDKITTIKLSEKGQFALIGLQDATAQYVDLKRGLTQTVFNHDAAVTAVALSADNRFAATGGADNVVKVWDLAANSLLTTLPHRDGITAVAFSPDNTALFTAAGQFQAQVWDIANSKPRYQLKLRGDFWHRFKPANMSVTHARFSSNGNSLLTGSPPNFIRQWDTESGSLLRQLVAHSRTTWKPAGNVVLDFVVNEEQQQLVAEAADGMAYIWQY